MDTTKCLTQFVTAYPTEDAARAAWRATAALEDCDGVRLLGDGVATPWRVASYFADTAAYRAHAGARRVVLTGALARVFYNNACRLYHATRDARYATLARYWAAEARVLPAEVLGGYGPTQHRAEL